MKNIIKFKLEDISYTKINLIFVLIINFLVAIFTKLFLTNGGEGDSLVMSLLLFAALFVHIFVLLITTIFSLVTGKFIDAKNIFLSIIIVLLVGVPYCILLSIIFN